MSLEQYAVTRLTTPGFSRIVNIHISYSMLHHLRQHLGTTGNNRKISLLINLNTRRASAQLCACQTKYSPREVIRKQGRKTSLSINILKLPTALIVRAVFFRHFAQPSSKHVYFGWKKKEDIGHTFIRSETRRSAHWSPLSTSQRN